MAFFRANNASAKLGPRLGVGVLLLLVSLPPPPPPPTPFCKLMPLSLGCSAAGLRPGRAGGVGAAGLLVRPLAPPGGGGGARGEGMGAGGGACSST